MTIGVYSKVKKLFRGTKNVEVHHIIEKRFLAITKNGKRVFAGLTQGKMLAVPMSKSLHKVITKRWREKFKYGYKYNTITKAQMKSAINYVYRDMPALRAYAIDYINEVWR